MAIRVDKTDPSLYRVQQTDERGHKRQQQEEKKGKDKFEKQSVWRRMLGITGGPTRPPTLLSGRPQRLPVRPNEIAPEEEKSLTFTERLLILWGVLGRDGRPQLGVILTYILVLGMILGATILIIGMSLWR